MNAFLQWTASPLGGLLWKWTALLALGWVAHGFLRHGHPRWRLMLWRGILILGLALPAAPLLSLPSVTITVHSFAPLEQSEVMTPAVASKIGATPIENISARPSTSTEPSINGPSIAPPRIEQEASVPRTFPWKGALLAVWALGGTCGVVRLIWFNAQLTRLCGNSEEPPAALVELAKEIQNCLDVRRSVRLRISSGIQSPFVSGVWRPVIMLPRRLVETLSNGQLTALLRHELAHLRGNDLQWSAGWRWLQVIGWFHPLVWRVSAAHSFACEQEADRVASGASEERESYAQFLAQLTLRVLALPKVETELTLNGSAQIVRRLQHLQRAGLGAWTRKHTAAGLGLVGFLFLMAVGCKFSESSSAVGSKERHNPDAPASGLQLMQEFKSALETKNKDAILALINWDGVADSVRADIAIGVGDWLTRDVKGVNLGPLPAGFSSTGQNENVRFHLNVHAEGVIEAHFTDGFGVSFPYGKKGDAYYIGGPVTEQISGRENATNTLVTSGFKQVMVEVQDTSGKPIEGAQITPFGFRVKGLHGADAYGWQTNVFGPKETVVTGPDGRAWLKYAVMGIPEEKEYTRALIFSVTHPNYSTVTIQDYPVEETNAPIQMVRGMTLEVSAFYGADHESVTNLVVNLADEGVKAEDWQKQPDGSWVCHKVSPGGHMIQLIGRLPSGEIVFSDTALLRMLPGKTTTLELTPNRGSQLEFNRGQPGFRLVVEMKPGIRLEGRLDDAVPRPIKNGRVMISIRPPEYPATNVIEDFYDLDAKYGGRSFWHSYRPINADGTFVFESVPPGEADVVVLGDGFATRSEGQLYNRVNGVLEKGPGLTIPQSFRLTAPVTQITVKTKPTATLEFTANNKKGQPIEGVWVGMFPGAFRMRGMYGWNKTSSEAPFREMEPLPELRYAYLGKTGPDGTLAIRNIPAEAEGSLDIDSDHYQVPIQDKKGWRDRHVRTRFEPGVTNKMVMVMEPKGTDYVGTVR